MTIKTTFERTTRDFAIGVPFGATDEHRRKAVAAFSKERLAEVERINRSVLGYLPPHTLTVDGREAYRLDRIDPNAGAIVYSFEMFTARAAEIVEAALEALRAASPVVSGAYRDGHTLYVNGVAMDEVPASLKRGDVIMISNPVPYSRRIEVGKTQAGRDFVLLVEPRVYERTTKRVIAPRFGNQAKITFGYAALPDAPSVRSRTRRTAPTTLESPAMFIEPLAA